MVLSQSGIPAADFLINRDPWLRRLGGRQPGRRISEALYECVPPILRGRPIYDRLPGAAQAYNKDSNDYLSRGTIILPEAKTVISTAEDLYFRTKFPELYTDRDYITGSFLGPGSASALFDDGTPLRQGDLISNREVLIRSALIFWAEDAIRDASEVPKSSIRYGGDVLFFPENAAGWIWIDGTGTLQITESLPDGVANLTGNIWCNPDNDITLGQPACAVRINTFERPEIYRDKLDVGDSQIETNWPPEENCDEPLLNEVSILYRFATLDGKLTIWEDFRNFNTSFEPPVAKYLTDYFDDLLQDKREQIDVFVDDYLNPDTVGLQFVTLDSELRRNYREQTLDQILDAWDFGLIDPNDLDPSFEFLTIEELEELNQYDILTHRWLDWLAQHFGFQDNGTINNNYWHRGSQFVNILENGEVFYTIAEKRTILRNALSQDKFQDFGTAVIEDETSFFWNLFRSFWNETEIFWNAAEANAEVDEDFFFTRFPFTVYNRIKPSEWYGLQRAKGTIKGLEFMFDTLGLHGYACTENTPRFYDNVADFLTPLIPFKFTNSVVVGKRKVLDGNGNIIETADFNTQGYDQTGIFKVGETIFMSGYNRKLVLRAPFAWDRLSQRWNRMQEIISTYAYPNSVVSGYYNFLTGNSAAAEPIWLPETCTSCKYIVTTRLIDAQTISELYYDEEETHPFYQNEDEDDPETYTWVQNLQRIDSNLWSGVGYDRGDEYLRRTHAVSPVYIAENVILAGFNRSFENTHNIYSQNSAMEYYFPATISVDNGLVFNPLNTVSDDEWNDPSYTGPILHTIDHINVFGANIYAIGSSSTDPTNFDIIYISSDEAQTWKVFLDTAGMFSGERFLDIWEDTETKTFYLMTDVGIYTKYTIGPGTWQQIFTYPSLVVSPTKLGGDGTLTPEYYKGRFINNFENDIYVHLYEIDAGIIVTFHSPNNGTNWFVENTITQMPVPDPQIEPDVKIRSIVNNIITDEEDIKYLTWAGSTEYNPPDQFALFGKRFLDDVYVSFNPIEEMKTLMNGTIETFFLDDFFGAGTEFIEALITDININYNTNRFEYLVTGVIDDGFSTFISEGFIFSTKTDFTDLKLEHNGIILNDATNAYANEDTYTTISGDFLIKAPSTSSINARPINEVIEFKLDNQDYLDAVASGDERTESLHFEKDDLIEICVPCFSEEDNPGGVTNHWTPIAAYNYLADYNKASWIIPTLRDGKFFKILNEAMGLENPDSGWSYYNLFLASIFDTSLATVSQDILLVSCEEIPNIGPNTL